MKFLVVEEQLFWDKRFGWRDENEFSSLKIVFVFLVDFLFWFGGGG